MRPSEAFRLLDKVVDILLGTQMIAKGWILPNVTLVGVLNGRYSSHHDFRSSERTFQLLTRGRPSRAGWKTGHVLIQTYNPNHYAIRLLRTGLRRGLTFC